tara:strand:+ start:1010 stop:2470 length:1461 start_codon:yes stop_codon:yes gene_type:complete
MVSPLVPFLTGATAQFLADEDASDRLKGDIIDGVSSQIYEVEIPEAQKQINNIKKIKSAITGKYGPGVAEAFDNIGLYESGDQRLVDAEITKYFNNLKDTKNISQDSFEKTVNELFEKTKLAGEEGQEASRLFKGRFGGQSMLALKTQQLDDRRSKVRELFNDRSNVRDLLVAPDAPKEGVRGFLFGDRVTTQDVPGATGRLTEATQVDVPEPAEAAPRVPFSALGFPEEGATEQTYNFENLRHRDLATKASANFERMFKNPQLGTYEFNFNKNDPRYDTAQRIIKGFNEARDAGYELGIIDYAREQYIDIVLKSQGVVNYLSNYQSIKPSDTATALQPGTTEGTQTGTKVDETQTVVGSEDVGAISAKAKEGETTKEAIEKTEKVSVPKSTVNIGTGDSAPAPSELNQNAPGLQLANDGMLYSRGKAVKMFAPLEREIEEASAIAFQIKASDLPEEVKQERLEDLRQDFLQTIAGFGITEYKLQF